MRIFEIEPGQKRKIPRAYRSIDSEKHFDLVWNKLIVPNCSEAIEIYRKANRILYRGSSNNPPIYRGRSFDERRPSTSNNFFSQLFDKMLAANGMTALRGNSVFATSARSHASTFGTVYAFFPINGFKFTYTNQSDLVLDSWDDFVPYDVVMRLNEKYSDAIEKKGVKIDWSINWLRKLTNFPPADRLEAGVARLKEMLPDDPEIQQLTADKLFGPDLFAKRYEPTNTDLDFAIKNGLEVYVQGQYYAIWNEVYGDLIDQKLAKY